MADRRYKLLKQGLAGDSGFDVGDLSQGEMLYWDGSKWQNTDSLTLDSEGDLNFSVNTPRIYMRDGTDTNGYYLLSNVSNSADFGFFIRDLADNNLAKFQAGGAVELHYAGSKAIETWSQGIITYYNGAPNLITRSDHLRVLSANSDNPYVAFYQDDATTRNGYIQFIGASYAQIRNEQTSGEIRLTTTQAGGGVVNILRCHPDIGIITGGPTGGFKGYGTINAEAVYDDNTLLTDYVFDAELDGFVDEEKWHAKVPNRVHETGFIELREHVPAALFAQRLDELDPAAFAAKWRKNRRLPAFDRNHGEQLSLGDYAQRLLETVEVQAIHIDKLRQRIELLEQHNNPVQGERV